VLAVPDQGAVEQLAANGADPAFRVGVRDRGTWVVRMMVVPSARKISSKAATNWPAAAEFDAEQHLAATQRDGVYPGALETPRRWNALMHEH
jgi:hypothetical protein